VIGIVGDTKTFGLAQKTMPQAYFPLAGTQGDRPAPVSIVVQGSGEPSALVGTLRSTVNSLDNSLAIFNVQTVPELIATSMTATTFQTFLLGVFAGLALLLHRLEFTACFLTWSHSARMKLEFVWHLVQAAEKVIVDDSAAGTCADSNRKSEWASRELMRSQDCWEVYCSA